MLMTTYFLYPRKSTDVEDKQVRSIDDQAERNKRNDPLTLQKIIR